MSVNLDEAVEDKNDSMTKNRNKHSKFVQKELKEQFL